MKPFVAAILILAGVSSRAQPKLPSEAFVSHGPSISLPVNQFPPTNVMFSFTGTIGACGYNVYYGPNNGIYTGAIGIPDPTITSCIISNVTSRIWVTVSAMDNLVGQEVFADYAVDWPPINTVVVITGSTGTITLTNPTGVGMFQGTNLSAARLLQ